MTKRLSRSQGQRLAFDYQRDAVVGAVGIVAVVVGSGAVVVAVVDGGAIVGC